MLPGHHIDQQRCRCDGRFMQGFYRITQITALEKFWLYEYCVHHQLFYNIYCIAAAIADTVAVHAVLSAVHSL